MAAKLAVVAPSGDAAYLLDLKRKFSQSQDLCEPARKEWVIDQSYYDGPGQWTPAERAILAARKQPDTYFNDVKPAVNGMIGAAERGKTDPRAYGRTPKDADAADVATDCLRYIGDSNRFQYLQSQARKDFLIQGVCCAVVEIDERKDVKVVKGRPEAFFYDPYSREPDFSDARYLGLANWMDEEDALALVDKDDPKAEEKRRAITSAIDANGLEINQSSEDRPKDTWSWADSKSRRVMVVQMWHRKGPIWHMCKFTAGGILEQGESPYRDADGKPTCQLIAQSCYVDGDNRRYGVVRDMRGPQDAQNKGWSKALHIISVAKLRVDPGTQDVDQIRREWAKPDGIIEARDGQIEELGDKQLLPAHIEMLQIAEAKMRRQSPTPASVGRQQSQSGRAQLVEQEAGATEQAPAMGNFDHWVMRIYRAEWACVKQFWDEPKYIRVTDDENAPKYIQMNEPAVFIGPDGQPVLGPDGQPQVDPSKPPINAPAQMDVDIIIDKERDTAVLAEEQFKVMGDIETARPGTFSPKMLITMSSLPRKRQVLDMMQAEAEEAANQEKPPSPAQLEEQKAAVQLQANDAKNKQNAEAHAAQLARDDEAKAREAQRAAQLADHQFGLKVQAMSLEAQHAERMKGMEADHTARMKQMDYEASDRQQSLQFDYKERERKAVAEPIEKANADMQGLTQAIGSLLGAVQENTQVTAELKQETADLKRYVKAPRTIKVVNGKKQAVPVLEGAE